MSKSQWLVRTFKGNLVGPLSTRELLIKISLGNISEDDSISEFPDGSWKKVSQRSEFYDFLLKVLSEQEIIIPENTSHTIEKSLSQNFDVTKEIEYTLGVIQKQSSKIPTAVNKNKSSDKRLKVQAKQQVISLRKKNKKSSRSLKVSAFLAAGSAIFLIGGVYFFFQQGSDHSSRSLISAPKFKNKVTLTRDKVERKFRKAFILFSKDNISSYVKSQSELISIIEGDPKNRKAFSLLCLSYLEIWPYTDQNTKTLKIISRVEKRTQVVDRSGSSAATCSIVYLFLRGQWDRALEKTELSLKQWGDLKAPPASLYYFKSILLANKKFFSDAINYITATQKIWPTWVKPFYLESALLESLGKSREASLGYKNILKKYPNHVNSRLSLAFIEFYKFNHRDLAVKFIEQALRRESEITQDFLFKAYIVLGKSYEQKALVKRALKYYRKAQKIDPLNKEIQKAVLNLGGTQAISKNTLQSKELIARGDIFLKEGNCNAAQAYYKSAYEVDLKNGLAALKAGECLWSLSLNKEAIGWVNKAIRSEPKLIEAYITLAKYYAHFYEFSLANKILVRARKISKRNYEIYKGYAELELARENPRLALRYAQTANKIYASDAGVYVLLAKAQLILPNKFRSALLSATKALELNSLNKEAHIVYAEALSKSKGLSHGLNYLSQRTNEFPLVIEYRIALGNLFLRENNLDQAVKVFKRATAINGKSKNAWVGLGSAYASLGDLSRAQKSFLKAALVDPSDANPLVNLGILHLNSKKFKKSIKYFKRAAQINYQYPLVHYYLGKVFFEIKKFDQAIKAAKSEQDQHPNFEEPYILLAKAYVAQKKYKNCIESYQKVFSLRPAGDSRNARTYVNMAACYRSLRNLEAAKDMVTQAQAVESGYPGIFKELGAIYEAEGNWPLATGAYEKYLLLISPIDPEARVIKKRLNLILKKSVE